MEFVLKYPGESWAAIGWKPLNNDGKCAALFHSATSGTDDKPIKTSDKKQVLEAKPATVTTPRTDAAFKGHSIQKVLLFKAMFVIEKNYCSACATKKLLIQGFFISLGNGKHIGAKQTSATL